MQVFRHSKISAQLLSVTIGKLTVWVSYDTLIAYQYGGAPIVIRRNDWGSTTGKHLNEIDPDHSKRIDGREFEKQFDALFENWPE